MQLQEVDQYDRERPEGIVGGNSNERDGLEWDVHTDVGATVQISKFTEGYPR